MLNKKTKSIPIFVGVCSLALLMGMATTPLNNVNPLLETVMAEPNQTGKITITAGTDANGNAESLAGKKFNVYRIFSAENATSNESINYTMNSVYENALKTVTGKNTEYEIIDYIQTMNNYKITGDVTTQQTEESRYSNFRYFVEDLRNEIVNKKLTPTSAVTVPLDSKESFTMDVPYGWYLIDEVTSVSGTHSASSLCLVNTVNKDININIKSDYPVIKKQILEDDNQNTIGSNKDGWNDIADFEIGQTVPYRYLTNVPNINGYESYYFAMHDRMDNALTFNKNSVVVKIGDKTLQNGVDYQVVTTNLPDNETFKIEIFDLKATVNKYFYSSPKTVGETEKEYGQNIVVEYNATLNDNARTDTGRPGFENEVKLEFSNNPDSDGTGQTGETPWDTVVCFTFKIDGVKVNDQNPELKLEGAKFRLYSDADCTQEVFVKKMDNDKYVVINRDTSGKNAPSDAVEMISDKNGLFNIVGLDSQTYYLKETKAPDGYRLLKDPIKIDVKATYNTDNRDNYVKGDGATTKTLQKLEATAHFKEFYNGSNSEYDNQLVTNIENGSINLKVVNKVGSILPATGSAMTLALICVGTGIMVYVLVKHKKETKESE